MNLLAKLHSNATPGDRLKHVRSLLNLSRSYLEKKHGLPQPTLKAWENLPDALIKSEEGVSRCIAIYRKEGIVLGKDWLLTGQGLAPQVSFNLTQRFAQKDTSALNYEEDEELCMIRDANAFRESHSNAVILIVSNDEMRPFYKPGDYVGGRLRYNENIETVINKDCIIQLKDGDKYFRRVIRNKQQGYNLTCLNPTETTAEPVIYNVEIACAAPVIWHRCRDD